MELYDGYVLHNVNESDLKVLKDKPNNFWQGTKVIGISAFKSCQKQLTSIKIPPGVEKLSEKVFSGCVNLQEISLPNSVTSIAGKCFADCESLTSITLPSKLEDINYGAFLNCYALKNVVLPKKLVYIQEKAFENCRSLEEVDFPKSLVYVASQAFSHCSALKSVVLPEYVWHLGEKAFEGCSSLREASLLSSIKTIPSSTFKDCSSLEKVELPKWIDYIAPNAFENCSALKGIDLPSRISLITNSMFLGCSSLKSIVLPESVTKIDKKAFVGCSALESITFSDNVTSIGDVAFSNCSSLEEVKLPKNLTRIEMGAFMNCAGLKKVELPENVTAVESFAFVGCSNLKYIKFPKDIQTIGDLGFYGRGLFVYYLKNGEFIASKEELPELEDKAFKKILPIEDQDLLRRYVTTNYRRNFLKIHEWKEEKKVKFIPPDYTLGVFPEQEIDKYFVNKNPKRWAKLIKTLGFDQLQGGEKNNSLIDLMKLYYAIGGFSDNQGECEKAYEYICQHIAKGQKDPHKLGAELHSRFSKLTLEKGYNKTFAQFFMRYYKDNPDFMNFRLKNKFDELMDSQDYLCAAHNNFASITKAFPNRVVNGNTERELLSPRFVAEHSSFVSYNDIQPGNEKLALLVGERGYSQEQFNRIQTIFENAKTNKDKFVIFAEKNDEENGIKFRLLEKDDPLGFVLGDITNCCQHIGGAAESCVEDGYLNANSGFIVFEEDLKNEFGEDTDKARILGQAYVWYDPETKTVCYDNIEIPKNIINELRSSDKSGISSEMFMDSVIKSAECILKGMNKDEIKVEKVTVGASYNDLNRELEQGFKYEDNPVAANRNYTVYSDARKRQYILKTYDEVVTMASLSEQAKDMIGTLSSSVKESEKDKSKEEMGSSK